jgi:hypothetical protein
MIPVFHKVDDKLKVAKIKSSDPSSDEIVSMDEVTQDHPSQLGSINTLDTKTDSNLFDHTTGNLVSFEQKFVEFGNDKLSSEYLMAKNKIKNKQKKLLENSSDKQKKSSINLNPANMTTNFPDKLDPGQANTMLNLNQKSQKRKSNSLSSNVTPAKPHPLTKFGDVENGLKLWKKTCIHGPNVDTDNSSINATNSSNVSNKNKIETKQNIVSLSINNKKVATLTPNNPNVKIQNFLPPNFDEAVYMLGQAPSVGLSGSIFKQVALQNFIILFYHSIYIYISFISTLSDSLFQYVRFKTLLLKFAN